MTKKIFKKILEDNQITWNDLVTLTVINPKYVKGIFNFSRQPKVLHFYGALGYTKKDNFVSLCVQDNPPFSECYDINFAFEEILGIRKGKL